MLFYDNSEGDGESKQQHAKDEMALNIATIIRHHLENLLGSFRACCVRDRFVLLFSI